MNPAAPAEIGQVQRKWKPYPAYKDAGVEWLGEVPDHWDVRRLKFVAPLTYGDSLSVDSREDGEVPVFGSNGPVGFHVFANTQGPALVIGRKGSFGKVNFSNQPCFAIDTTYFIDGGNTKEDMRWLFYLIPLLELDAISEDSAVPGLRREFAHERWLPLAPPREQRAIANFLDRETAKLDALVKKKERLIELLQEKRTAIISQAVTKGLDTNIPLKESGTEWLGKIPVHWEVKRLKQTVPQRPGAIKTGPFGSQLLASEMIEGEVKVYNQENVIGKDLSYGENYISEAKFEELRAFAVAPGDVLLTTRGTIGRCVILPDNAEPGILHPCLMRIQPDSRKLLAKFLTYLIQDSTLVQTQIFLLSNATTIAVIYSETMRNVVVALPPIEEQQRIVDFLDRETAKIDTLIAKVREGIEKLKEYRTALISAAVTGKIDVQHEAGTASQQLSQPSQK